MTRMGIRELRDSLTTTVRRVAAGEVIEITHHGRAVAVLAPVSNDRVQRLIDSGDVSPAESSDPLPRPVPVTTGMSASEALQEDRSER